MGLGIIFILVGFIGSVAFLFGLIWYLMKLGGEDSDATLIAQNKANPLQKKATGKDLRPWAAILVLGGLLTVSATTIFVFQANPLRIVSIKCSLQYGKSKPSPLIY